MYRICVITDGTEYPLHEPFGDDLRVISPVLSISMDTVGSLTFQLPAGHPYVGKLLPLRSEFYVYDDDDLLFCGRMVKPAKDYYNTVAVTCEGELAYLIDSQQRPYEFSGTAQEFLGELLKVHNSQVEERKKFQPGQVNVTVEAGTVFSGDDYQTSLNVLKGLMELTGGHPRIRHDGGNRYLDLLKDFGGFNPQPILFGENLLDLSRYQDATMIFTRLIPTGADIDYTASDGTTQTKRLDITSVNDGKEYIEHDAGIAQYGRICGYKRWDDVTDPDVLLAKAKAYLDDCVALPETLEINAVDLSLIHADVEKMKLGYWTNVISIPHDLENEYLLTKKEMHLDDPGKDRIVLGDTRSTFTGNTVKQQAQVTARIEKVASNASKEINRKVENATQLITGGRGGYVVLDVHDPDTGERMHPWRILIMDTPNKETASHVIQLNQNGLGFSTTGINGPYRNAWTIDGNLVADFITAGTMLADRIRGGTLEVGGTGIGKNGAISVKDQDGNLIGNWDKDGLFILQGILQGVSAVFGGLNNQDGTIEVKDSSGRTIGRWDKDGLFIIRGDLSVGPSKLTEDGALMGDWEVSADGTNIFRSLDGSVIIQTADGGPLGDFPAFTLTEALGQTKITSHQVEATGIYGTVIVVKDTTQWGGEKYNGNVGMILDDIWGNQKWGLERLKEMIEGLKNRVSNVEDEISSLWDSIP